ncbi:MAG TPA: hypothetical protein VNV60_04090 [Holophagaceae bacterium]|jgi:hypothetical protein|nr:hypothetical protein [Holophagaceae bacterium]
MLGKFLSEVIAFKEFYRSKTGTDLQVNEVALSKTDILVSQKHWSTPADILRILPILGTFSSLQEQTGQIDSYAVSFAERVPDGRLSVAINSGLERGSMPARKIIRIESTIYRKVPPGSDLEPKFKELSAELNRIFGSLIPRDEMARIFRIHEEGTPR